MRKWLKMPITCLVSCGISATSMLFPVAESYAVDEIVPEGASAITERHIVKASKMMVVSGNQQASEAGMEILKKGGSAVDAAIAVQMVLNIVEPQASGIGGGGFLVFYNARTQKIETYDGRETAPLRASPTMFLNDDQKPKDFEDVLVGGMSVAVPGVLRMLELAHKEHGKVKWATLFESAIKLARDGFNVSDRLYEVASKEGHLGDIRTTAHYFLDKHETPKKPGTLIKNPELADTFTLIAEKGASAFYTGDLANDIVKAIHESPVNPGVMSLKDLASYKAVKRAPVCMQYHVYSVCGMGAPSSGPTAVLQALGILSQFDLASLSPQSVKAVHVITEATRLAFADRNLYLADGDKVHIPAAADLLNADYLKQRSHLIDEKRRMNKAPAGDICPRCEESANLDFPSTTHFSIVDQFGNVVSMTSSIEHAFGSSLMVRGFLLNNQMTDFAFEPQKGWHKVANRVEPGKRPRSSMSPMIVLRTTKDHRKEFYMAIGSPGGAMIIPFVLQTIIAVLDWNLDIQEAISMPHFLTIGDNVQLEKGTNITSLSRQLQSLGHPVEITELTSGLHGIVRDKGIYYGGADPRREGLAVGE
ncbi:MAG: gamma-glutamyltransferase [Alphaproteobacteria bacterium]|nr:gamma-glutamyltransferase [Alphaproteobacteria bacterium]